MPPLLPPDRHMPATVLRRSFPGPSPAVMRRHRAKCRARSSESLRLHSCQNSRSCFPERAPAGDPHRRAHLPPFAILPGRAARTRRCSPYRSAQALFRRPPARKAKFRSGSKKSPAASKVLPESIVSFFRSRFRVPQHAPAMAAVRRSRARASPAGGHPPASAHTPAARISPQTGLIPLRHTNILTAILFVRFSSGLRVRRPQTRTRGSKQGFASACRLPRSGLLLLANPLRSGMSRRRADNAAGTSFGKIAATCTQPFAATLLSSHSVSHRRNSPNILDKRASARIQGTARTASGSTPSHCPPDRESRNRSSLLDAPPLAKAPTHENQNFRGTRSARLLPMENFARTGPLVFHTPPGEIVLRSAALARATLRKPSLPRGSHTRAIPWAAVSLRTSPYTSIGFRRASRMPGAGLPLFPSIPTLPRSRARDFRSLRLG